MGRSKSEGGECVRSEEGEDVRSEEGEMGGVRKGRT
jgi:hypothetical protein